VTDHQINHQIDYQTAIDQHAVTSRRDRPMTDLRERLAAGETVYGTFLGLGCALAAEACALAGFDWLLADLEHGGGGESTLLAQQLAADAHGVPMLVRVESGHRIRAGRVLDLGAAGVMFPRLESAAQAALALSHLRYPPLGDRGVATYNRACGFGLRPDALATANDRIACIIQIENRRAVEQIDEIAAVPGIDVLFVGPRDLSHDLGVPGDFGAPSFRDALDRIRTAADKAGIACGILASDAAAARRYADEGFRFVGVGSDATLLSQAGKSVVDALRASPREPSRPEIADISA
jgi:2-dehydro-3-deoxyglucarate aldolase/4-hydroxy-2-oxoheptanedioate aldolase